MKMKRAFLAVFVALVLVAPRMLPADAAAPSAAKMTPAQAKKAAEAAAKAAEEEKRRKLERPFTSSFFFSAQDLIAIQKAQHGAVSGKSEAYTGAPIPQIRRITLSGIIYRNPSDWLIWINGHKVVPGRLLPEMVSIKVHEDNVHLKWFDIGFNGVIDITIKPHQTYDIVTGIMLPESG